MLRCGSCRSPRRHILRSLFFLPAFLTIFFCIWAAYISLLPLSASLSKHCSSQDNKYVDAADCNDAFLVRHRSTLTRHPNGRTVYHGLHQLERSYDNAMVPRKPLHSVDLDAGVDGDDRTSAPVNGLALDAALSVPKAAEDSPSSSQNHSQPQQQAEQDEASMAMGEVIKIMANLRQSARSVRLRHESDIATLADSDSCEGQRVFIYKLPSKFNVDLLNGCLNLIPWQNMCDFLANSGMGEPIGNPPSGGDAEEALVPSGLWHETHQYVLEILFHERLKQYKCLTTSAELADIFYVPYYGGFDVLRWHFVKNASAAQRDELGLELIRWLKEQPTWQRKGGMDHVLVLGKITWDFRRPLTDANSWGSSLLLQDEMQNPMKLLIERQPWQEDEVGVPHPTFFHPRHDMDIRVWQDHILSQNRTYFVSFAGQSRPQQHESIRSQLIRQCTGYINERQISAESSYCRFLNCSEDRCLHPHTTMEVFVHSEFCMQPPGDSPTRRSVFDSLIAGCIPVLFDPYTAYYQYPWHLPEDTKSYSVFLPSDAVREGKVNVVEELRRIPASVRHEMRLRIIHDIMPGLVYARPDARLSEVDDAFMISLRGLFARVSERLR